MVSTADLRERDAECAKYAANAAKAARISPLFLVQCKGRKRFYVGNVVIVVNVGVTFGKMAAISAILLCHFCFALPFQRMARLSLWRFWQRDCRRQDCHQASSES
jgi:hypothetical protein